MLFRSKLPVLLACVLINVPLIIWFLISFFQDLPEEVEESAKVDGATEWQLFCRIVLPLVAPGIAAVAMLSFMYAWNEYTYTVIFTRTAVNNTVPLALALLNTEDNLSLIHISMLFPLETSIPTAFISFLLLIGYGFPPFPHCLFNLLGDASARGGSTCCLLYTSRCV